MVATSGPLGLYAGVGMTLLGALPFEGIKFGLYDLFNPVSYTHLTLPTIPLV